MVVIWQCETASTQIPLAYAWVGITRNQLDLKLLQPKWLWAGIARPYRPFPVPISGPNFARKPANFRFHFWAPFLMSLESISGSVQGPKTGPETVKKNVPIWNNFWNLRGIPVLGDPGSLHNIRAGGAGGLKLHRGKYIYIYIYI